MEININATLNLNTEKGMLYNIYDLFKHIPQKQIKQINREVGLTFLEIARKYDEANRDTVSVVELLNDAFRQINFGQDTESLIKLYYLAICLGKTFYSSFMLGGADENIN